MFVLHEDKTNEKFVSILAQLYSKNMTLIMDKILQMIKFNKYEFGSGSTDREMRFTYDVLSRIMLSPKLKILNPLVVHKLVYQVGIHDAYAKNVSMNNGHGFSGFGTSGSAMIQEPVNRLGDLWQALVVYCQCRVKMDAPQSDYNINCDINKKDGNYKTNRNKNRKEKDDDSELKDNYITIGCESENKSINKDKNEEDNKEDNKDENKGQEECDAGLKLGVQVIKMLQTYFLDDFELEKLDDQFVIKNFIDTKILSHERALAVMEKIVSQKLEEIANVKQTLENTRQNCISNHHKQNHGGNGGFNGSNSGFAGGWSSFGSFGRYN